MADASVHPSQRDATPENPLLAALPPVTDYITYLTLLEHNMTPAQSPVLQDILVSDESLTVNIGWDLVLMLLPMLPESRGCLDVVARTGNPREVLLKVVEALRVVLFDAGTGDDGDSDGELDETEKQSHSHAAANPADSHPTPLAVLQFETLLHMLEILHARLRTKKPSRFLSTTLQAVLAALSNAATHLKYISHVPSLAKSAIELTGSLRKGMGPPPLPPRSRSSADATVASTPTVQPSNQAKSPDPEAEASTASPQEKALQTRLLQSFLTHLFSLYTHSLQEKADGDFAAFALSTRIQNVQAAGMNVPGRLPVADMFRKEDALKARNRVACNVVQISGELELGSKELLTAASAGEEDESANEESQPTNEEDDEPPGSVEEVPLSNTGALFTLAVRAVFSHCPSLASNVSAVAEKDQQQLNLPIFPHLANLLHCYLPPSTFLPPPPLAVTDALLALNLLSLHQNLIGEPSDDAAFHAYLDTLTRIFTHTPSPRLRGNAHYLASTVLRSHPDETVRTTHLEKIFSSPSSNDADGSIAATPGVKAVAIGWLKGEIVDANFAPPSQTHRSLWTTPTPLHTLASHIFPPLRDASYLAALHQTHLAPDDKSSVYRALAPALPFHLALLNLLYLLLRLPAHVQSRLDVPGLLTAHRVREGYVAPLGKAADVFDGEFRQGGEVAWLDGGEVERARSDMSLLKDGADRVLRLLDP